MCKITNLREDPFTRFSAEEDLEILNEIFYRPSFYSNMISLLQDGISRSILGQRGQGKSVVVHKLCGDLMRKNCLPLLIDRYDGMPQTNNKRHFMYKIVQKLTLELARKFVNGTLSIHDLPDDLREKYYVLVEMFYDTRWAPKFMEEMKCIKNKKAKNCISRFFNRTFIDFINQVLSGTITLAGESIRRAISPDTCNVNLPSVQYTILPRMQGGDFKTFALQDAEKISQDEYISIINILMKVVSCTYIKSVVVLFDKVDEFDDLKSDVKSVATFMEGILRDNELLYRQHLSVVFSLWSEVYRSLNNMGVRFDKFPTIDIRWDDQDLEKIINKRLEYFSENKNAPVSLGSLIPEGNIKRDVLRLADRSPRTLLRLLSDICSCDERENIVSFSPEAISRGMMKFCKNFDYASLRPFKIGGKEDLTDWINKILAVKRNCFTVSEWSEGVNSSKNVASKHIEDMRKAELIREKQFPTEDGAIVYEVFDPRILHLLSRGVNSIG